MSQGTSAPSLTVSWQRVFVVGILLLLLWSFVHGGRKEQAPGTR